MKTVYCVFYDDFPYGSELTAVYASAKDAYNHVNRANYKASLEFYTRMSDLYFDRLKGAKIKSEYYFTKQDLK